VYTYGSGSAEQWWKQMQAPLKRFKNISVYHLETNITELLAQQVKRMVDVQVSLQDGEITWHSDDQNLSFTPETLC